MSRRRRSTASSITSTGSTRAPERSSASAARRRAEAATPRASRERTASSRPRSSKSHRRSPKDSWAVPKSNSAGAALVPGGTEKATAIRESAPILFTDIVGSTELTQRHRRRGRDGVPGGPRSRSSAQRSARCAGREVKHTGDGIMASFSSAVAAARCAARDPSRPCRTSSATRSGDPDQGAGSAPRRASPSRITWISSARRSSSPRALCARTRQPAQSLVSNVVCRAMHRQRASPFEDLRRNDASRASSARCACTPSARRRVAALACLPALRASAGHVSPCTVAHIAAGGRRRSLPAES